MPCPSSANTMVSQACGLVSCRVPLTSCSQGWLVGGLCRKTVTTSEAPLTLDI